VTYCVACKTHNGKHAVGCVRGAFPASASTDEVATLRAKIELMREMGVTEADGIKLGPAPQPAKKEETEAEWKARQAKIAARNHQIMFASSSSRPVLRIAPPLKDAK
jgi:hypothetical protein